MSKNNNLNITLTNNINNHESSNHNNLISPATKFRQYNVPLRKKKDLGGVT